MRSGRRNFKISSKCRGWDYVALIAPLCLLNFKKQLKIFKYNRRLKQGVLMKKFYLKIWLLAFIMVFVVIPAAAQSSLTGLIKLEDFNNEEQRMLFKSCDYGDGKYGSCNKLVEILSKECDGGDMRSCAIQSDLLRSLRRIEEATKYLIKLCDANSTYHCFILGTLDIYLNGNMQAAIKSLEKVCNSDLKDRDIVCKNIEELKACLKDKECNPIKKGKIIFEGVERKLYGEN